MLFGHTKGHCTITRGDHSVSRPLFAFIRLIPLPCSDMITYCIPNHPPTSLASSTKFIFTVTTTSSVPTLHISVDPKSQVTHYCPCSTFICLIFDWGPIHFHAFTIYIYPTCFAIQIRDSCFDIIRFFRVIDNCVFLDSDRIFQGRI